VKGCIDDRVQCGAGVQGCAVTGGAIDTDAGGSADAGGGWYGPSLTYKAWYIGCAWYGALPRCRMRPTASSLAAG
jgi:hypothetical protein